MSRQKLGQHFLADPSWRARIAQCLKSPGPPGPWLEIGAGHGEMTEFLARWARRVVAIEADAQLAREIRVRAARWPHVQIVHADILALDLAALLGEPFHVYGNLPYYITSPILRHLFGVAELVQSIHIVIQREVAERIVAPPGGRAYGYLSALCQYYARPRIRLRIPPGAFRPPPKVSSALVSLDLPGQRARLGMGDDLRFLTFLGKAFAMKRKTLRNNLKGAFSPSRVAEALAACQLDAHARAEELSLAQFARLYGLLGQPRRVTS